MKSARNYDFIVPWCRSRRRRWRGDRKWGESLGLGQVLCHANWSEQFLPSFSAPFLSDRFFLVWSLGKLRKTFVVALKGAGATERNEYPALAGSCFSLAGKERANGADDSELQAGPLYGPQFCYKVEHKFFF